MALQKNAFVYIGNWDNRFTKRCESGFGICRYYADTGELKLIKTVHENVIVSATCVNEQRNILYCSHDYTTLPGYFRGGGGMVYAFAIDPETGNLTEINHQPSYGSFPSYIALDATGKYLIATIHTDRVPVTKVIEDPLGKYRIALEYDDAGTVLFRINADGSIGDPCDFFRHSGDGGPLDKQTHPQLHSVMMSPSGNLFAVTDKGNDQIYFFRINRKTEKLEVCGGEAYRTAPGTSPRYSVFHPTRPYLFVNFETKAVVSSFRYHEDGRLEHIGTANALPEGFEDFPKCQQSDIRIHPSGKYLYTMIRGHDVVSVFAIDEQTGQITKIQSVTVEANGPRGCAISADGRFMLIAALWGKKVLVRALGKDGKLAPTGQSLSQPHPGTVTFFPA